MELHRRNLLLLEVDCESNICFCCRCRQNKVARFSTMPTDEIYTFIRTLGNVREMNLERVFFTTLKQIANGKAYHDACLRGTRFKKWKAWAKKQDYFKGMPDTKLTKIANFVNDCRVCYERWDDIVKNLTDPKFSNIDASTLSVHYLRRASSRNWCTKYNDSLAIRRVQQGDPLYSPARYQEILQMVVNTGIIGELDHNPRYVASFFGRIQSDAIAIARRTNPS